MVNIMSDMWACPECGFLVTDVEYFSARYDYDCSRCHNKKLSEFNLVKVKRSRTNLVLLKGKKK